MVDIVDRVFRVDLGKGSSWYFPADTTPKEQAQMMLFHVHNTLKEIEQSSMPQEQRDKLLQRLAFEMDFARRLLEETT